MISVDAVVNGTRLWITCSGDWGVGSEGTPSGRLLNETIKRFMKDAVERPSEVVIDFTKVDYLGGDGPGWSLLPYSRYAKVTYLVNDRNEQALRDLFSATNLDKLLNITFSNCGDG